MNSETKELLETLDKDRPWYLNGYAEILVLAMIPVVLFLSAFLR